MRKSAAVLLILSLMMLSGCRVAPAGETGTPTPGPDAPSATPLSSPTPPPETKEPESEPPQPDQDAEKEDEVLRPVPEAMSEEERYQFALDWCEEHRGEFLNAELYAMDRRYWFADYAPGVTELPFDGGSVYFYEDAAGSLTPIEVVDAIFRQAGACFDVSEPEDWAAAKERLARKAASEAAGDENAVERFLAAELAAHPDHYPGIGADMWLCGAVTQTDGEPGWYVMMKQGNVYRLQWDPAFKEYVSTPEVQVRIEFDKALEAYHWFGSMTLPYDMERSVIPPDWDGGPWYAVDYPGISTMLELRTYLKNLFSDEIVDMLLSTNFYQEIGGVLYEQPVDGGETWPADMAMTVRRESETKLVYHMEGTYAYQGEAFGPVTLDFPYEKVGDKWVFTEFSWPG